MRPPPAFETARLHARIPRSADAAAVFSAYANDPEVTRYLSWRTYAQVEPLSAFLAERERDWNSGASSFAWLLCLRGTDTPIGAINISMDGPRALFGYVLGRSHWGRGLMAEALQYGVDWALGQPALYRAWAFCDAENIASRRVMEKAGMSCEGLFQKWHVSPNLGPTPRDCLICAKVKDE